MTKYLTNTEWQHPRPRGPFNNVLRPQIIYQPSPYNDHITIQRYNLAYDCNSMTIIQWRHASWCSHHLKKPLQSNMSNIWYSHDQKQTLSRRTRSIRHIFKSLLFKIPIPIMFPKLLQTRNRSGKPIQTTCFKSEQEEIILSNSWAVH